MAKHCMQVRYPRLYQDGRPVWGMLFIIPSFCCPFHDCSQRPTSDFCCSRPNKAPMSTSDCCVSRYTDPRKLSGMETCSISKTWHESYCHLKEHDRILLSKVGRGMRQSPRCKKEGQSVPSEILCKTALLSVHLFAIYEGLRGLNRGSKSILVMIRRSQDKCSPYLK